MDRCERALEPRIGHAGSDLQEKETRQGAIMILDIPFFTFHICTLIVTSRKQVAGNRSGRALRKDEA